MGDFNTPFIPMDGSSRQKINKKTQVLNETLDQIDLIDIYKGHCIRKEKNILSFQEHTEHSPG